MDHVRGSSLAWPATLETLRPFILTWWSGRTVKDMPAEIRAVFDAADFGGRHVNLALVVLHESGKVLRKSVPEVNPGRAGFGAEAQGKHFKAQLDAMLDGLKLPKVDPAAKPKLTLPDICTDGNPSGARIYLSFAANRLNHYRTPIVEAVPMTDALRKSLRYEEQSGAVAVEELKPWLEQIYPAAIMDGLGGFRKIDGKLRYDPAGVDATHRYATIDGTVDFELDNESRSTYKGELAIVLKYRLKDNVLESIRGVWEGVVPKGTERIRMTAAIESRPE